MVPLRTSNLPEHATQIPDVPPACDSSVPSRGGLPEPTHRPTSGMVTSELSTFRAGLKPVTQANSAAPTQLRAANPGRVIRSATGAGCPSRPTGERFRTHRVPPPIRPQTASPHGAPRGGCQHRGAAADRPRCQPCESTGQETNAAAATRCEPTKRARSAQTRMWLLRGRLWTSQARRATGPHLAPLDQVSREEARRTPGTGSGPT
jgi:hypothetical protein